MSDRVRGGLLGFWLVVLAACGGGKPSAETETHFLRFCDDACGDGLSCICGVCTEPCTDASACTALHPDATCSATPDACGGSVAMACEMTCASDGECSALGADYSCAGGFCRAQASVGGASGAGGGASGASGASGQGSGGSGEPDAYHATLESDDTTLCPGECTTLHVVVDNGVEPYRYAWSGVEASADATEIEVCPDSSTTYAVTVMDSRSSLGEFGGDDQETDASLEIAVDADCEEPPDNVVPTCELRIPYTRPDGLGVHTALESQTLMTTDSRGNALLVGSLQGTVGFGDLSVTSAGIADGFLLKLSPNCEPLWVKAFGAVGDGNVAGLSAVGTTPDDEIFVVGTFTGAIDFGDGVVSAERDSIIVLKLDASGELIWQRHFSSGGYATSALDIGVTDSGDVVFGGYAGPDTDFGGGAIGGTVFAGIGVSYVARLSGDGEHQYSYAMLGGGTSHAPIAVHPSGLVAISGSAVGDVEVAGHTISLDLSEGERYVAVLDDAGAFVRSLLLPFVEPPAGGRTYLVDTGGASVVFGSDQGMLFDQGCMRVEDGLGGTLHDPQRIVKVDASGGELWTRERAYLGDDVVGFYGGLALDSQGNIIHADEIGAGASVDGAPITLAGEHDVYVEKLSPAGDLIWSRSLGAELYDRTWALTTDLRDAVWITYVEGGQYAATSSITVITKLAPDTGASIAPD